MRNLLNIIIQNSSAVAGPDTPDEQSIAISERD